ncbi:MAG: hypothetical protein R3195_19550 [Gemmatimonadota bacterium]|nr:hypothetical protein [Gemmatimonadota bacterium]
MRRTALAALTLPLALMACDAVEPVTAPADAPEAQLGKNARGAGGPNALDRMNAMLEAQDSEYRIAYAEYYTVDAPAEANIILAKDVGNQLLCLPLPDGSEFCANFIPDDDRRVAIDLDPNTIDVVVDLAQGATTSGLSVLETTAAIERAMQTWDDRTCSTLGIQVAGVPADIGLIQALEGFGGTGLTFSDIVHAGFLPAAFFEALLDEPGGGTSILGVTFTLTFTVGDLDGNGLPDVGAREIYYNDGFAWADDGVSHFDFETVALHEAGHGLSQGHFGTLNFNPKKGTLRASPLAVMNAGYTQIQRSLKGTDNGGHCTVWGSWPN